MKGRILIVNDNPEVRELLNKSLYDAGYCPLTVPDGPSALRALYNEPLDLILLNLVVPGEDAIDLCIRVRERSDIPVIVLSAYDQEELKVKALDMGADDYMSRPFGTKELLARMRAVMRRARFAKTPTDCDKLQIGKMTIDLKARRVSIDKVDLGLTWKEAALLAELARNADRLLTHDELLEKVWGAEFCGSYHYLHTYFGRIRRKMGPEYASLLRTVPREGYVLHTSL